MAFLLPAVLAGLIVAAVVKPDLYTQAAAWLREKLLEAASSSKFALAASLAAALAAALSFAAPATEAGGNSATQNSGSQAAAQAGVLPTDVHAGGPHILPGPPPFLPVHDDRPFMTYVTKDDMSYKLTKVYLDEIRPTQEQTGTNPGEQQQGVQEEGPGFELPAGYTPGFANRLTQQDAK